MAINASNPVRDAAEGFRLVNEHENADFAFIHDSAEIKYEISRSCNLTEVGEVFAEQPYAIAVQQGSQLHVSYAFSSSHNNVWCVMCYLFVSINNRQDDLSRSILELQKERYFEHLTNKYWNNSAKSSCPNADDNEGITLESLGGVFIATLFGLALAMVTLAIEVVYYKRRDAKEAAIIHIKPQEGGTGTPPPVYQRDDTMRAKTFADRAKFAIGDSRSSGHVSFISAYPRRPLSSVRNEDVDEWRRNGGMWGVELR